jgi:hypothetical protein
MKNVRETMTGLSVTSNDGQTVDVEKSVKVVVMIRRGLMKKAMMMGIQHHQFGANINHHTVDCTAQSQSPNN